jgi:sodium-dependent dicarboxylate transporter 2/3/5
MPESTPATLRGIGQSVLVGVLLAGLAWLWFPLAQALLLGCVALLVTLWTNQVLPLGVVSLLPLLLFPALQIADTRAVSANYAKPIIFLFLGGFMLALAVEKTGLHKQIARRLLAVFPNTARGVIYSLALTAGLLSAFLSNSTTALLLMPLALFLSDDSGLRARFALAVAYGASVGGIITPIGTPPNLLLLGMLAEHGLTPIPFMQWVLLVSPLALAMFALLGWLLSRGVAAQPVALAEPPRALDAAQKKVARVLLALVALLLVNAPFEPWYAGLGLDENAILLGFGLLMFTPPLAVLRWEDARNIPYEIVFLFGAGFSIAFAFGETGLSQSIADRLLGLSSLPPLLLLLLIATLVTFTTEITSNTALVSMLLPVLYAVTTAAGLPVMLFLMVATLCASYAFMLPIATPPNAIALGSKAVTVAQMARVGLLLNLAGIGLITAFATLFWARFLG